MSLSKKICLRSDSQNSHSLNARKEDNYRRDSFDDRFCDDLCEEILKYLSLEDKLRLECVSKQFQRTVFQRQYELYINIKGRKYLRFFLKGEYFINREFNSNYNIDGQTLDSFKALLKKCPNITSINLSKFLGSHHLDFIDQDYQKIGEVARLIIENCNNLREAFAFNDIIVDESIFEEFHQKYEPKIKYLPFVRKPSDLSLFPNIEQVKIGYLEPKTVPKIVPQLKLAKLKQFELALGMDQEHLLQIFIDSFPTLTHFKVVFYSDDENAFYKSLKNISKLKHLIHFKVQIEFGKNDKRFYELLEQMANNCQNLKSIESCFHINRNSDIKELLFKLKAFPALKRLNLRLYFANNEGQNNIDVNQLFSFELLKGFSNITHLSLSFNWRKTLKDSILKEIDINLPKLQYLEIENLFDTNQEGVQQMADILSRLSRLEKLVLYFKFWVDFKPIEEQITEKCRKIRKIHMKYLRNKNLNNI